MLKKLDINHRRSSRKLRSGFTLVESLIAIIIMSLIFLGAMNLFIVATRTTMKASSTMFSNMDGTQAILHVIDETRESQGFDLPLENTFAVPAGFSATGFSTTYGTEAINTAIELSAPPALQPSDVGYQPSDPAQVSIVLSSGTKTTISPGLYNHDGNSVSTLLIYRGDPDGTPDPNPTGSSVTGAGTYLWEYSVEDNGASVRRAICKTVAPVANGVQFVRPTTSPTTNTGTPEPFEVEVKIISSYYSLINGRETSEETNGAAVSQLSGKCVYMRDHSTAGTTPSNANKTATNNAFQYAP